MFSFRGFKNKGNTDEVYKKIPWEHDGKKYEIRIMFNDKLINILPFHNNRPVNGFRYQIQLSKNVHVKMLLKSQNFSHLIEYVKDDIRNERWKLLSKN